MLSEQKMPSANTINELNVLRQEALELLDRCLHDQTTGWLEGFIEQIVASDPPAIDLLSELAEDVHYRLLALRQFHFDICEQTLRTLRENYGLRLRHQVLPSTLDDIHALDADLVIQALCADGRMTHAEATHIRELLGNSIDTAQRAHNEMQLAQHLYTYIVDWLTGLRVLSAHQFWSLQGPHHRIQRVQ